MTKGDIKYQYGMFNSVGTTGPMASGIELGDILCPADNGWRLATASGLAVNNTIAVALEDADNGGSTINIMRAGVIETDAATGAGTGISDGMMVSVADGGVDGNGTAVANAVMHGDSANADDSAVIRIW